MVYQPNRSMKVTDVRVSHLIRKTRYKPHLIDKQSLHNQVEHDKEILKRYVCFILYFNSSNSYEI